MSYELIIYEKENGIGTITLNRPKQRNAVNPQMAGEMDDALDQAAVDKEVKVIIITGAMEEGKEAFCAGMDLKGGMATGRRDSDLIRFVHGLELFEKPVIAAINGFALGGGGEIALSCDLRIASTIATFGFPEVDMGAFPGAGGSQRLPRLIGVAKAKELLFTGMRIDAEEACRIGLVNKVVAPDALMDEANKLGGVIASKPPQALKAIKSCVNVGMQMDIATSLHFEKKNLEILMAGLMLKK